MTIAWFYLTMGWCIQISGIIFLLAGFPAGKLFHLPSIVCFAAALFFLIQDLIEVYMINPADEIR